MRLTLVPHHRPCQSQPNHCLQNETIVFKTFDSAQGCARWRSFDGENYRYALRAECGAEFRLPVRWLCLVLREAPSTKLRFRENRLSRRFCIILRARRFLGQVMHSILAGIVVSPPLFRIFLSFFRRKNSGSRTPTLRDYTISAISAR